MSHPGATRPRSGDGAPSNPNHTTHLFARHPWRGEYLYAAASGGRAFAVWPDSRDVVAGSDLRARSEDRGFSVHAPCHWEPDSIDATAHSSPAITDDCLDQGGLDINIYGSWIR